MLEHRKRDMVSVCNEDVRAWRECVMSAMRKLCCLLSPLAPGARGLAREHRLLTNITLRARRAWTCPLRPKGYVTCSVLWHCCCNMCVLTDRRRRTFEQGRRP